MAAKRIIVACDGTGQSASRGDCTIPTNVSRICHALSKSQDTQQIIFYQSGVGTQDLGSGCGFGNMMDGALGKGLEDHVADGYHFIMNNFEPGDTIFLFGFSRGAFTARVIANIVARLGVIVKADSWALKGALKAHRDGTLDKYASECLRPNEHRGLDIRRPRVHKPGIEVVGCWDTVASLGVSWRTLLDPGGVSGRYKNFNGGLVKGIRRAFHALALDEYRGPFTPTLWYLPENRVDAAGITLRQCWFPGAHSNIGGGYPDRALANLTLAWMIDQCHGLLDFDQEYLNQIVDLHRNPSKFREDEDGETGADKEYQGWGRGKLYNSYKEGQTWTWKYRTPGAADGDGRTQESMHASVRERWEQAVWEPKALKGFELVPPLEGAVLGWSWVKTDSNRQDSPGSQILEFPFPETVDGVQPSSLEWKLRHKSVADVQQLAPRVEYPR